MKITLNINADVAFEESPQGRELFDNHFKKLGFPADEYRQAWTNTDGKLHMQLWKVMEIFGPGIAMGMQQLFKDNRLHLESGECVTVQPPRRRYDIEKLHDALNVIDDFNNQDLATVDLYERNQLVPVTADCLERWRFIGLNNKSFVEMEFWNDKPSTDQE